MSFFSTAFGAQIRQDENGGGGGELISKIDLAEEGFIREGGLIRAFTVAHSKLQKKPAVRSG